jgi:hypothetical protein
MEAAQSFKTLVPIYQTAQHQNTEDHDLITHNYKNLKSYKITLFNKTSGPKVS